MLRSRRESESRRPGRLSREGSRESIKRDSTKNRGREMRKRDRDRRKRGSDSKKLELRKRPKNLRDKE